MLELHDDYEQDEDSDQSGDGQDPPKWDEYDDIYIEERKRKQEIPALPPPNISDTLIEDIYKRQKHPADSNYGLN